MADEVILGEVNISSFIKAFEVFNRFRKQLTTEQEKAGAIQAFEFTFEQTWKLLKKVLLFKGIECSSPRETFRLAAREGLIDDPERWFVYLFKRNLTSHTYNQEIVDQIISVFDGFAGDLHRLLAVLRAQE